MSSDETTGPLIGICPWSALNNKSALMFEDPDVPKESRKWIWLGLADDRLLLCIHSGNLAVYGDPDAFDAPYKSLDRHHTHFICVDDGTVNRFGGEVNQVFHFTTLILSRLDCEAPLKASWDGYFRPANSRPNFRSPMCCYAFK